MSQFYFDVRRVNDPHALPDGETFHRSSIWSETAWDVDDWRDDAGDLLEAGWYWWACLPGCLPDGDPTGPFGTERAAREDAQRL